MCHVFLFQVPRSAVLLPLTSLGDRQHMWTLFVGQQCSNKLTVHHYGFTRYKHLYSPHMFCVYYIVLKFNIIAIKASSPFANVVFCFSACCDSFSSFHTSCSHSPSSCTSLPCSGVSLPLHISPLTSTSSWRSSTAFTIRPSDWQRIWRL